MNTIGARFSIFSRLAGVLVAACLSLVGAAVHADHTTAPTSVAIAGSLQDELGCPGDWQPECAATELIEEDGIWQNSFALPAGDWEYKANPTETRLDRAGDSVDRDRGRLGNDEKPCARVGIATDPRSATQSPSRVHGTDERLPR